MKVGAMSYAKLIVMLSEGVYSTKELVEEIGITDSTTRAYVNALRKEGMVHVASWEADGRGANSIAIWKLGHGVDAVRKPKHKTPYERNKTYRMKKRALKMIERMAA